MTVKIVLPEPSDKSGIQTSVGTKVFNHEGAEIENITSIDIRIRPNEIIEAKINVYVNSETDLDNVHALLGTETLEQVAAMHSFELSDPISSTIENTDFKVDFKVDCSEIKEMQATLDVLAKYADELPQAMKDELAEIIKEK